jgi:hypothetical protein
MEKTIAINGKVAQVGRAAVRVPIYLETFQVRRGSLFGAQGHSGHAIFPSVIREAIGQSVKREDGKIIIHP